MTNKHLWCIHVVISLHTFIGTSVYNYSDDLRSLAACINPNPQSFPPSLSQITTPLKYDAWNLWLNSHPDQSYANFMLQGIASGFRIGFQYSAHACLASTRNHPSALECPSVISESLSKEVAAGRLFGPLNPSHYPQVQVSSLGTVPKKHVQNKWRLILDLSHPKGHSVNDGINKPLCSLTYTRVDNVVQKVITRGKGTLLAKIDIESAFRNVPVHPHDRHLLGMIWENRLYIDNVLPFGLRSAPKIFNAIADGLQWVAEQRGVSDLDHFLDDFITTGNPGTGECAFNLKSLIDTCQILGLPLALHKLEGPCTCLTFLGIEVDTVLLQLRLPSPKLIRLRSTINQWAGQKCCTKKDLESLIGQLHDASIVIKPGRTFIRRLLDLLKSARSRPQNAYIRLNLEARSDILWWQTFIAEWNGLSMMRSLRQASPDVILTSDASGGWGCGAFWCQFWFQLQWPASALNDTITVKELLPIVIAAAIWGPLWQHKAVLCHCDNEAVVYILNSGTSKDPNSMSLLRCLFFFAAKYDLLIFASHIPGSSNQIADALSRNNMPCFFTALPQASPQAVAIPPALMDLLVLRKPDWTSPSWTKLFSTICNLPLHNLPAQAMQAPTNATSLFAISQPISHTPPVRMSSVNSPHTSGQAS